MLLWQVYENRVLKKIIQDTKTMKFNAPNCCLWNDKINFPI